jgi:hypothetical protein
MVHREELKCKSAAAADVRKTNPRLSASIRDNVQNIFSESTSIVTGPALTSSTSIMA